MEVNKKRAEAAKDCFDFNKNINTVHVTDDLQCFADRNAAVNHARTLENTSIDVFDRDIDEADFNEELSDDVNEEVDDVPDFKMAVVKAQGGAKNQKFEKVEKPAKVEPPVKDTPAMATDIKPAGDDPGPAGDEGLPGDPAAAPVLTTYQKGLITKAANAAKKLAEANQQPTQQN